MNKFHRHMMKFILARLLDNENEIIFELEKLKKKQRKLQTEYNHFLSFC